MGNENVAIRALAWVLLVAGCGGDGQPGEAGGGAPTGAAARCVGQAVEAYKVRDSASCLLQGSDWDSVNDECRGTVFSVHCSRADESGRSPDQIKSMCLDMPGCGWTENDGTVTHPTGHCEGTKIPCAGLAEASCKEQSGCTYFSSSGCESTNGFTWLDNVDCSSLQIADDVSYSVVRSACQRAMGCTWVP